MMDPHGHIYVMTDEEQERLHRELRGAVHPEVEEMMRVREDAARLDGYLRARAEADALKRAERRT